MKMTTRKTTLLRMSTALALTLGATTVQAEITQDCILEGTVTENRAAEGGERVRVSFRSAERGEAAPCRLSRSDRSRRIQFKAPSENEIADAPHGARVKYRYTEDVNGERQWRLIERSDGERL
jgi:hypothetical protein